MGDGELAAVFKGLAEDAGEAGGEIAKSIATFTDETATIEDGNVARTLAADANTARAANAVSSEAEPGELADAVSGDPGENQLVPVSSANGSARLFKQLFPELPEVNAPRFGLGPEWQNNCQSCVNAVDNTLAGSPASAVPVAAGGFKFPESITDTIGGGQTFTKAGSYDDITQQMTDAGDGARGVVWGTRVREVAGKLLPVPGHVFNVTNIGGRIYYIDGQIGNFANLENFHELYFIRTN